MKKTLTLALAFVLVAALAIGGTVAYLTATTDEVVNTFTVGKVALKLDEKNVTNPSGPDRVTANKYHLIPGSEYEKDPTVHVLPESEACYVFVKVENGLGAAEKASGDGYVTIAEQIAANDWTAVPGNAGYFYKIVEADAAEAGTSLVVFEEFGISGTVSQGDYAALANANITIKACAVQSEGLATAEAAFEYCPAEF